MRNINLRYVDETYDRLGRLTEYKLKYPDNYNFGYDIVDDIAQNDPQRCAMIWCNPAGEERTFTFADIKKYSDKTANFLTGLGIKKGDFVLVTLKRHYQFWFVAVALHKMGAVLVPATFMLKKHDVEYRVQSADIKAVISTSDGETADAVDQAEKTCPSLKYKIIVGKSRESWIDFDSNVENADQNWERVETNVYEPMIMYFSSGTSGYPKMVLHNHLYSLGHLLTAKHWHTVKPDGLHLTIADTGWGKAVWGKLYGQWLMEACIFVYDFDRFSADEILGLIGKYKITTLCCPPTMFRMFLLAGVEKYDLSSLEYANIAGEALSPAIFDEWFEKTGVKLMEGFGQTETTLTIANLKNTNPKPGSMGKPVPQYDIDIVNGKGNPVGTGETGEIVIKISEHRPEGLMMCYYKNEEKTAKAFEGGVYHTGDTAWKDEDGYYWYVGRTDDIIKSSGYRIGPFEIESVLLKHPAVLECAITGVPDRVRGQIVKATIVLLDGFEPSEQLEKDLQDYVKKETAPYKYPRVVEFVDTLPKTINGKIRRVSIRENDSKN